MLAHRGYSWERKDKGNIGSITSLKLVSNVLGHTGTGDGGMKERLMETRVGLYVGSKDLCMLGQVNVESIAGPPSPCFHGLK